MHPKMKPEMATKALPKQTIKDPLLHQSMTAQSHIVNPAVLLHHQNLITTVAHLIVTKDPQAVVDIIVAAECVVAASVVVVASAALVERFPSAEVVVAGEAGVAVNHST